MISDERTRALGRWHASAEAERIGPAAVLIERLIRREGRASATVLPIVRAIHPEVQPHEIDSILARLPERTPRPRLVGLETTERELATPDAADTGAIATDTRRISTTASGVVCTLLASMTLNDRMLLRLRFGSGMSIADVGRMLKLPQRPLYRRLEALLGQLRHALTAAGIDAGTAADLIGDAAQNWTSAGGKTADDGRPIRKSRKTGDESRSHEPETWPPSSTGNWAKADRRVLGISTLCRLSCGGGAANETLVEEEGGGVIAGPPESRAVVAGGGRRVGDRYRHAAAVRSWRANSDASARALAPEASRVVEPRLTGGFRWAAYRGPMRATGQAASREQLKLTAAAARVIDRAEDVATVDAQHEAGVAYVMIQQPDVALERLRKVAAGDPQNARVWNDLAAAHYAAAEASGNDAGFADALTAADEGLRIDPQLAEARFNRALVLERMGLAQQARAAWQRYLEVDPSSSWADEARQRLKKLTGSTGDGQFRDALPRLEQRKDVPAIVAQFPQQSRAWGEAESLGRWGEALQRGDAIEAVRWLDLTRDIGDALTATTGETLLRDAVRAVDTAGDSRRATLADASVHYRRGRIAYSRQQPSAAEPDLRAAAARFGSSPMALVARYFAACTRFDQNGVAAARTELQSLLAATPKTWVALGAQIRWQLALCSTVDGDWTATRTSLTEAQAAFRHLGERSNEGFIQTLLAQTLMTIGRPDAAWTARIRSFELLSREGRGDRLPSALLGTAAGEVAAGRGASAASLFRLAEEESRATANHHFLSDALVRHAMLDVQSGRHEDAARAVREAKDAASQLTDPRVREGQLNHVRFATAAVALRDNPRQAYELLTTAIENHQATARRGSCRSATSSVARSAALRRHGGGRARSRKRCARCWSGIGSRSRTARSARECSTPARPCSRRHCSLHSTAATSRAPSSTRNGRASRPRRRRPRSRRYSKRSAAAALSCSS